MANSNIGIYDNNQFAYRKESRTEQLANAPRKMRRHLPLWLDILIILVIIGGLGAGGYFLTHPSPHHSSTAIATNFAEMVGSSNYLAAANDVDPADRATALSTMRSQGGVPGGAFADVHSTKLASSSVTGTTGSVVIQSCNVSLACNDLPALPTVEIAGKWYVSWSQLIQSLG
jgi:cytoskeletal protein RodZ